MKYTYRIEVHDGAKWVGCPTLRDVAKTWGEGWIAHHRESRGPRPGLRLVRDDGRVMDEAPTLTEASIGMIAGFPTAQQYEDAAERCLEQARLIREREARQGSRGTR